MKRVITLLVVGVFLLVAAPASADSWERVARYNMDEGPRQHVLHDTWNGLNGVIGDKVVRKGEFFRFPKVPFFAPLDVERTLRIWSDDLNPEEDSFSVTWRQRTDRPMQFRNIMQKGQGSPEGGMFKFRHRNLNGVPIIECFWRGSDGAASTRTPATVKVLDGRWHVYRCARVAGVGVEMRVDGALVDTDTDPGTIANTWPLSVGGNITSCNSTPTDARHCNYWAGDLDWIKFRRMP